MTEQDIREYARRFAGKQGLTGEDVNDAESEAIVKWLMVKDDPRATEDNWIRGCIKNTIRNFARQNRRIEAHEEPCDRFCDVPDEELSEEMQKILNMATETQWYISMMRADGKSWEETGKRVGMNPDAARKELKKFRSMLERSGMDNF
jgi:DNA-directed RNA polymerase specialized sigma24 family protein